MVEDRRKKESPKSALIKTQLQRTYSDRASEELPEELLLLIGKLKEQDAKNEK